MTDLSKLTPNAETVAALKEAESFRRLSHGAARTIGDLETALREVVDCLGYEKNEGKSPAIREANAHSAWKIALAALSRS